MSFGKTVSYLLAYLVLFSIFLYSFWLLQYTYKLQKAICDQKQDCELTNSDIIWLQRLILIIMLVAVIGLAYSIGHSIGGKRLGFIGNRYFFLGLLVLLTILFGIITTVLTNISSTACPKDSVIMYMTRILGIFVVLSLFVVSIAIFT